MIVHRNVVLFFSKTINESDISIGAIPYRELRETRKISKVIKINAAFKFPQC